MLGDGGLRLASAAANAPAELARDSIQVEPNPANPASPDGSADAMRTDDVTPPEAPGPRWGGFAAAYGVRSDRDAAAGPATLYVRSEGAFAVVPE